MMCKAIATCVTPWRWWLRIGHAPRVQCCTTRPERTETDRDRPDFSVAVRPGRSSVCLGRCGQPVMTDFQSMHKQIQISHVNREKAWRFIFFKSMEHRLFILVVLFGRRVGQVVTHRAACCAAVPNCMHTLHAATIHKKIHSASVHCIVCIACNLNCF